MRFLISLLVLIYWSSAHSSSCKPSSQYAKFECAKAGDDLAFIGDFKGAKKFWKVSCEKVLEASCREVKEMDTDLKGFVKNWDSDPTNNVGSDMAQKKALSIKCKSGKAEKVACIAEARRLSQEDETDSAVMILKGMCDNQDPDACFEPTKRKIRLR